jgi:type I restriction enzyme M protein
MASSASDAGNKDKDIRQKLVESGHVDVMMSIGPKFFYTRSLPCTLWFFDKGKPEDLLDTVLMIDARNVYTVVSARSHVFSDEQLANLTAITWLYRGEHDRFTALLASYHTKAGQHLAALPERLAADELQTKALSNALRNFAKATEDSAALAAVREKLADKDGEGHGITNEALAHFRSELAKLEAQTASWDATLTQSLKDAKPLQEAIAALPDNASFAQRKALHDKLDEANPDLKAALAALEARHKGWLKLLDLAEKSLRARQWAAFDGDATRDAKKALLPRDAKKREKPTVRDMGVEAYKRASYFVAQAHWLLHRFPDGLYEDVPGLCKAVTRQEIADNDYSLTAGRYVGIAPVSQGDDDAEAFVGRMREIHSELSELTEQAITLSAKVQQMFSEWAE